LGRHGRFNIFTNDKALAEAQNMGIDKHSIVFAVEFQDRDKAISGLKTAIAQYFEQAPKF
jgi:hypothetical protein